MRSSSGARKPGTPASVRGNGGDPSVVASQLRLVPQQQRARGAVVRILEATGHLLDEVGFEGLTTTAIAARAGVNIATLYRYFPDKFAVLQAFAVSLENQRLERAEPLLEALATAPEWRDGVRRIIELAIDVRNSRPGARTLRRALQSSPDMWRLDAEIVRRMAIAVAGAMARRKPGLAEPRAQTAALAALSAVSSLLDVAYSGNVDEAAMIAETYVVAERYLSVYLD